MLSVGASAVLRRFLPVVLPMKRWQITIFFLVSPTIVMPEKRAVSP